MAPPEFDHRTCMKYLTRSELTVHSYRKAVGAAGNSDSPPEIPLTIQ
jgi:hypothetical protein